jgi:choline dehydrogenase-like flavoprotein
VLHIDCMLRDNEKAMTKQILADGKAMMEAAGAIVVSQSQEPGPPGLGIHEMGTACMGKDPRNSVLNAHNQAHDVDNLYITDGAAMASSGCQNPSLTYMALSARAAEHASQRLKAGQI